MLHRYLTPNLHNWYITSIIGGGQFVYEQASSVARGTVSGSGPRGQASSHLNNTQSASTIILEPFHIFKIIHIANTGILSYPEACNQHFECFLFEVNAKAIPLHATKTFCRRESIAPTHSRPRH
jgi:hypothetical protein